MSLDFSQGGFNITMLPDVLEEHWKGLELQGRHSVPSFEYSCLLVKRNKMPLLPGSLFLPPNGNTLSSLCAPWVHEKPPCTTYHTGCPFLPLMSSADTLRLTALCAGHWVILHPTPTPGAPWTHRGSKNADLLLAKCRSRRGGIFQRILTF